MMKKAIPTAVLIAACSLQGANAATDYSDGHGKVWRQPAATEGFTWNQVDALCATDGLTACGGSLAGWTWATQQQVIDLLNLFLPPTHQMTVANPGVEAMFGSDFPFAFTVTFAMNGAPYSFFNTLQGWTATLASNGQGIRGGYYESGGPVSFFASVGVNDPFPVDQQPGFLNDTGIWLWQADPTFVPLPGAVWLLGSAAGLLAMRRRLH